MNETGENAALFYSPRRRSRDQIDRERSPARALGKGSRLDIAARLDGEMVNLEVQVRHEPGYLKRTLYYWSLLYSTSLERRGKYIDTVRTVSLGLLDFELLPEEREYRNSYSIRNDASGRFLCDDLQIIYFELPKARRERKAGHRFPGSYRLEGQAGLLGRAVLWGVSLFMPSKSKPLGFAST